MKLTQKRVKELIALITKERDELKAKFINACFGLDRENMEIITKYNHLGGQIYAYQKILQIMQIMQFESIINGGSIE